MESIPSSSDSTNASKRTALATEIDSLAQKAIDSLAAFRKSLPFGHQTRALIDLGEGVVSMIRLPLGSNADFQALSRGVTDKGIPWIVRILARMIGGELVKATPEQLRTVADYARRLADKLEEVAD